MNPLIPRSRFFDEFFRDFPSGLSIKPLHGDPLPSPDKIKVEVKDRGKDVVVNAELPGVSKNDIQISVDNDIVNIQAEVKQYDADSEESRVLHSERYYGSVRRSFSLPCPVDQANAKATYENGILTLTLPKQNLGESKKISVE